MNLLTKKEREALLIIFKDFTNYYNANSISKSLKISHVGAQKIFKRLFKEDILINKRIGKAIVYKLNFKNNYVKQLITFLLADEANSFKRWREEFKELFDKNNIIMIYGSAIKDYSNANDIDIMIVIEKEEIRKVNNILRKKEEILPKKLHSIKLTHEDLLNNIKNSDKVITNIIKNAVILYGQEEYMKIMENVASF